MNPVHEKTIWKAGNLIVPTPAALVSCQAPDQKANLITIAWCGNINSTPPMLSISVQPIRFSHAMLEESGEFVVNLPSSSLAWAVDYCGVVSGRDHDKFAEAKLTPYSMDSVACPAVLECPVNIACRVRQTVQLGSHTMFLADVLEIGVDSAYIDKTGKFQLDKADLLCYAHGNYYDLGKMIGHFGWSVRKKTAAKPGKTPPRPSRRTKK